MKLSELTIDILFDKYGKKEAKIIIPILYNNYHHIYNFVVNHCKLNNYFTDNTTDIKNADGIIIDVFDSRVRFTDFKTSELQAITYIQTDSDNLFRFVRKLLDYALGKIKDEDKTVKLLEDNVSIEDSKKYTRFQTEDNTIISQELDEDLTNRTIIVKYTNGMIIIVPCAVKNKHNISGE